MKIKNLAVCLSAVSAVFAGSVSAQEFGVTLKSTQNDGTDTLATRLFNDAALTDSSDVGDPVWLVFDVDGDGIWNAGGAPAGNTLYDGTAAGLASALIDVDDYVIMSGVLGPIQGRVNNAFVSLPAQLQTGGSGLNLQGGIVKPSYALLFNDVVNKAVGESGTFGFNGTLAQSGAIPSIGNVSLRIGENLTADAYTFTVVPEPASAAYAALGLGVLAFLRLRRSSRQ